MIGARRGTRSKVVALEDGCTAVCLQTHCTGATCEGQGFRSANVPARDVVGCLHNPAVAKTPLAGSDAATALLRTVSDDPGDVGPRTSPGKGSPEVRVAVQDQSIRDAILVRYTHSIDLLDSSRHSKG